MTKITSLAEPFAEPLEQVWGALTDLTQLAGWLPPPFLQAALKKDAHNILRMDMNGMLIPIATHVADAAAHSLNLSGYPDERITAQITLVPANTGTRLNVEVNATAFVSPETITEISPVLVRGWQRVLANLRAYLGNADLPYPEGYVGAIFGYRREFENKYAVERSIWMAAPMAAVWHAITDPALIQSWFSPNLPWTLTKLEVGGRLYVRDAESGEEKYTQVIETLEPPRLLILRTPEPGPNGVYELTRYALNSEKDGTRLTLTNAGYALPDAERPATMEQNSFGFGMYLENIRAVVTGAEIPYPYGF